MAGREPILLRKQIVRLADGREMPVLLPAYRRDAEWMEKAKVNALVVAEDRTPPSAKLRALYWVLLAKVVENHPFYSDTQSLNVAIKHALKYYDDIITHNADLVPVLRSNNQMERNFKEYKEFCDRAFDFIVEHILPVSKKELIREVESMLGFTYSDALKGNRGKDTGEMFDDDAGEA